MSSVPPRTPGIYQILCIPTQKVYVGSSLNIAERWWEHHRDLQRGTHHSRYLQRAWDKYGEDAFVFAVLEHVDDPRLLMEREQAWMDATRCYDRDYGYNLSREVGTTRGVKASEETRAKMREARAGKPKSPKHVANQATSLAKDWWLIDPEGTEYQVTNLKQFCLELGFDDGPFHRIADGRLKSYKGWRCVRMSDPDAVRRIAAARAYVPPYSGSGAKRWIVISPQGEVFHIESLRQFCRQMGLSDGAMVRVADGNLRQHKGWRCIRAEDIEA